jgi:hypothetical protein
MTRILKKSAMLLLGAAVFVGSYTWDGQVGSTGATLISPAEARIGRPLTPVSYAGVARRTTRRVVGTAAVVGAAYAPVYVAPAPAVVVVPAPCTVVVDTNGNVVRPCP